LLYPHSDCTLPIAGDDWQPGCAPFRQAVFRAARIETAKPQLRDRGVLTFGSGAVVAIAMNERRET
jgi:hypothetical protein